MSEDEATRIAAVIMTADGGCRVCVRDLAKRLTAAFPDFVWQLDPTGTQTPDPMLTEDEVEGDYVNSFTRVMVSRAL